MIHSQGMYVWMCSDFFLPFPVWHYKTVRQCKDGRCPRRKQERPEREQRSVDVCEWERRSYSQVCVSLSYCQFYCAVWEEGRPLTLRHLNGEKLDSLLYRAKQEISRLQIPSSHFSPSEFCKAIFQSQKTSDTFTFLKIKKQQSLINVGPLTRWDF